MYVTKKSNSIFPCSYTCHNILPCIAKKKTPNKQKQKNKPGEKETLTVENLEFLLEGGIRLRLIFFAHLDF